MLQYSSGLNSRISFFSINNHFFKATDCTRPKTQTFLTLRHKIGLIEYPTKRSKMRRACCASTKSTLMVLGSLNAAFTASLVISLNTTRFFYLLNQGQEDKLNAKQLLHLLGPDRCEIDFFSFFLQPLLNFFDDIAFSANRNIMRFIIIFQYQSPFLLFLVNRECDQHWQPPCSFFLDIFFNCFGFGR